METFTVTLVGGAELTFILRLWVYYAPTVLDYGANSKKGYLVNLL